MLTFVTRPGSVMIETAGPDSSGGVVNKLPHFEILAYSDGELRLAGWTAPVIVDLADLELLPQFPILTDHDVSDPIGHGAAKVAAGSGGQLHLIVRGVVSVDSEKSRDFVVSSKNSFPWEVLIGAQAVDSRFSRLERISQPTVERSRPAAAGYNTSRRPS